MTTDNIVFDTFSRMLITLKSVAIFNEMRLHYRVTHYEKYGVQSDLILALILWFGPKYDQRIQKDKKCFPELELTLGNN